MRATSRGLPHERGGRPRPRTRARLGRDRRHQIHDGDRRDARASPVNRFLAPALGAAVLTLAACSGTSESPSPSGAPPVKDVVLQVFAAASLTDAFGEIEAAFEDANPGVDVQFYFAGSSDLAT